MRVLYFINGFDPGGAEHGLLTLVQNGFFEGHDLRVVGMCRGRGELADVLRVALGRENVRVIVDREDLTLSACAMAAVSLAREIRRRRPDVVVLSLKQANIVGRLVLRAFPGVRCVSFEHISRYRARRGEGLYGALLTLLSARVDEIWSDCRETLEATRTYFKPRARREAVVPLFSVGSGLAAKREYKTGMPLHLAAAGRLVGRKNFDKVILAVKKMTDAGTPVRLTVFGDGPEAGNLQALVERLGLSNAISLPGYRAKWFEEARNCDIFINASDTEGFCIVVAEAMAVGLPVIATDVGGIREYGEDGGNMLKLESHEVDDLVSAIGRLAGDAELRRSLGERACQDMQFQYSGSAIRTLGHRLFAPAGTIQDI